MTTVLDKVATVALIAACTVMTVLGVVRLRSEMFPPPATPSGGYQVGEKLNLATLTGTRPQANQHTLLMILSSTCHYCEKSLPLYQDISKFDSRKRGALKLAILGPEPQELLNNYVRTKVLSVDSVGQIEMSKIKVRGTPTLLLVGPDEKITNIWTGYLGEATEKQLRTVLSRL
jgi:thioredoxin-related protein